MAGGTGLEVAEGTGCQLDENLEGRFQGLESWGVSETIGCGLKEGNWVRKQESGGKTRLGEIEGCQMSQLFSLFGRFRHTIVTSKIMVGH